MHQRLAVCLVTASAACLSGPVSAQADWTELKITLPPKRGDHVLVADGVSLWLWGGRPQPGNFVTDDTWRYLGNTWIKQNPKNKPAGRWHARAAWDSDRNVIFLFGGRAPNNVFFDDTWELTAGNWVALSPKTKPAKRERCGLAYDSKRKQMVMFGGRGLNNVPLGDMWVYEDKTKDWRQINVIPKPSARWHPCMAYDKDREVIVLFGGAGGSGASTALNDTWEWDGVKWTKLNPKTSPPTTYVSSIIYDEFRQRMVMFGGVTPTSTGGQQYLDTTWEFDGQDWLQRKPQTSPPPRGGSPLAYLRAQKRIFVMDGFHPTPKQRDDFWMYETNKPADFTQSGAGCSGAAGTPALSAASLPWTGDTMNLVVKPVPASAPVLVSLGFSKTQWGPFQLPLDLKLFGGPGCNLYTGLDLLFPAANANGTATLGLPIPADTALAGGVLYHQALVVEQGANTLGAVFSNLGEAKIGAR